MRGLFGGFRLGAVLAVSLLASCASVPPASPDIDPATLNAAWALRQQQLGSVHGFQLNGRVAVKGGGLSGALRWQQEGAHFSLRIAGPFGAGALSMEGTAEQVAIKGKDIDIVTTEPQLVLAQRTGWRLPLDSLRWWVLGLPDPQSEADVVLDADGRALQMQQAGWTLRYSDYRRDSTPALPGRIEAVQPTATGEWMATVVLDTITLTP